MKTDKYMYLNHKDKDWTHKDKDLTHKDKDLNREDKDLTHKGNIDGLALF